MKGYIYKIENKETHTAYIGSTVDFERRIRQHLCKTRYEDDWHKELHKNPDNFEFVILEVVEAENVIKLNVALCDRETYWYNKTEQRYNKVRPAISFQRGTTYSDERKQKQIEAHIGKPHKSEVTQGQYEMLKNIFNEYVNS